MDSLNIPIRRRPLNRKRSRVSDDTNEKEEEIKVVDTKEESLFATAWEKAKEIGIRTEILDEALPRGKRLHASVATSNATGSDDLPADSTTQVNGLQNFSTESKSTEEVDPLMAEYIEKRLKELIGNEKDKGNQTSESDGAHDHSDPWLIEAQKGQDFAAQNASKSAIHSDISTQEMLANPSMIYSMPSYLRTKAKPKVTDVQDSATGTGGMILGGTGIVEVALPDQLRKEAESIAQRAYQDVLEARKLQNFESEEAISKTSDAAMKRGGSYSSNFEYHKNEHSAAAKNPNATH